MLSQIVRCWARLYEVVIVWLHAEIVHKSLCACKSQICCLLRRVRSVLCKGICLFYLQSWSKVLGHLNIYER